MKWLLAVAFAIALVSAPAAGAAGDTDGVWIDGVVYDFAVTGPAPAGSAAATPVYVIAPISVGDPLHPLADALTHGFGAHDHVTQIADPSTAFTGVCDLVLVVPGPKGKLGVSVHARKTLTPAGMRPLLYAARLTKTFVPLDRVSRIRQAMHLRLAAPVDTQTPLSCAISPRT